MARETSTPNSPTADWAWETTFLDSESGRPSIREGVAQVGGYQKIAALHPWP